ncbi:MAG: ferredoxin [Rhizobacter sp.]|nr:ferredoxin [Rhizobacter sp.]
MKGAAARCGEVPIEPADATARAVGTVYRLRLMPGDVGVEARADNTLLASAIDAGITLRSSCRNGTCRTCICRLRSGTVAYRIEWPGLSLDEKEDGLILPCVAYPTSDVTVEAVVDR